MDAGEGKIRTRDINVAVAALRSGRCTRLYGGEAGWGDAGAGRLADALTAAGGGGGARLEEIDLYRNHIGDEGARAIADALHSNSVLVKLVIGNQRIGNKGALAFADALERDDDPALRELNLSKNRIGAEGAAALAHAMMTRQKRQHPITIKGLEEAFHHGTHNEL